MNHSRSSATALAERAPAAAFWRIYREQDRDLLNTLIYPASRDGGIVSVVWAALVEAVVAVARRTGWLRRERRRAVL